MTEALAQLGGLGGVAALLTSLGALWQIGRVKKDTQQLQPNHGSSVADGIRSIGHQVGELRRDLADERKERRASDQDLRDRIGRLEGR